MLASTGPRGDAVEPEEATIDDLGVSVTSITDDMREQFAACPTTFRGVVITGVEPDSCGS